MIQLQQLGKYYQMGDTTIRALDGLSLSIEQGEMVAIMGPSGSGKSTLMNILGCLITPDEGSYRLNGHEVASLDDDQLAATRSRDIGFVFQSFNLQARRSALDNVMMPLRFTDTPPDEGRERARQLLDRIGLGDRLDHSPGQLSGGQRQRVAIARSLINQPSLLLADEPTGNLDSRTTDEIMQLFCELHTNGQTIVLVTHEEEIAGYAQRVIHLRDGQVHDIEVKNNAAA